MRKQSWRIAGWIVWVFLILFVVNQASVIAQDTSGGTIRDRIRARIRERIQQHRQEKEQGQLMEGDQSFSLVHGGLTRTYLVHVPASYDGKSAAPLVVLFHGGGGTPQGYELMTLLNDTSEKYGFLVAYPQGTGHAMMGRALGTWNAGHCCDPAMKNNVDDVGFVSDMLNKIEGDYNVDTKQIFATGHSNGAMMAYRLAGELSDRIAAVAPVGGDTDLSTWRPSRPISIMHFHGTADPCDHYAGGKCGGCASQLLGKGKSNPATQWNCEPIPRMINQLRQIDGLPSPSKVTFRSQHVVCRTYGPTANNSAEVTLCTIEGMGHTWPGGTYGKACQNPDSAMCAKMKKTLGPLTDEISANEMMWQFFKAHPLH